MLHTVCSIKKQSIDPSTAKIIEELQPLLLLVNGIVDYSSAAVDVDAVRLVFISVHEKPLFVTYS